MFLNLQANKIENIQRIIKGNSKLKPRLKITTKGLLRKHILVSMSNNNKMKFMKKNSTLITNIKLEVMADFIHSDQTGITIVTNKVALLLNLQTIKKYIKNMNYIEVNEIKVPYLL